MLKLKRVEVQGFKSFCERTELRFNGEGIAAIVGPNGCGKSNISDAISWVLGEQSAKSLRGARMEDVIFAGTRDRKPLGMAYVTMTLVDPDVVRRAASAHKLQPVEPAQPKQSGEITITRRLYRSGESEYLIDGHAARLRDIQDLFMGTGLGPESYAIIEQGRIGQILSSKPQDRRAVIEEAAGITKFKTRKRLAEAKLEGAKQNLARVFDILEEVTRQVNSLKRQAAKAKRYGELKAELESRLRVVLSGKYRLLERDAAKSAIDLNLAAAELKSLTASRWPRRSRRTSAQQLACYEIEQQLTEARQQLSEQNVEAERTRGRLESQVKESGAIEQRIAQAEKESQELGVRLEALDQEIADHKKNLDALEAQTAQSRDRMIEINQQREALQGKVRERERAIEAGRQVILRLLGEASTLKNQLAQIDEYLAGIERETARADARRAGRRRRDRAAGSRAQAALRNDVAAAAGAGNRHRRAPPHRRGPGRAPPRRRPNCAARSTACSSEVSQIRARKESLEQVLAHRTYTTESVKRLFASLEKGKAATSSRWACWPITWKWTGSSKSRRKSSCTRSWNTWWSRTGSRPSAGSTSSAPNWMAAPPSWCIPSRTATATRDLPEPAIGPETGIAARLSDSLRLTNGFKDRAIDLLPRVSLCFLAEDRDGGAAAVGGLSAPLLPAARRRLLSRPHRHRRQEVGRRSAGDEARGARADGEAAGAAERAGRDVWRGWTASARRSSGSKPNWSGCARCSSRAKRTASRSITTCASWATTCRAPIRGSRWRAWNWSACAATPRNRPSSGSATARAVEEKERLRAEREEALEARAAGAGKAGRPGGDHRRRACGDARRTRRPRRAPPRRAQRDGAAGAAVPRDHRTAATRSRRRSSGWASSALALLADNIELDQKAAVLAEQITALEARVNEMATQDAGMREALRAGEEELKALRAAVQEWHEKRSQIEVELVRKQAELKFLDETSRKELNCAVEELAAADEPIPDADAIAEAEQQCNEVREPHRRPWAR